MQNNWKELTNLILLRPSTSTTIDSLCDYQVLTIKNCSQPGQQPDNYTLPGGPLHASDFSCKWVQLFERFGIDIDSINALAVSAPKRPPIITDNVFLEDLRHGCDYEEEFISADIGLRIATIRHVFRQTGILLVESMSLKQISLDEINEWRKRVGRRPEEFIDLCNELDLRPDLWSLQEWWNWLTPASVGRCPRFDTIYYICCLNSPVLDVYQPLQSTDPSYHWCCPQTLLRDRELKGYALSPPQTYELSRLLNFDSIEEVYEFAIERQKQGIERWLPVLAMYGDGTVSFLPGDDYYPKSVDLFASKPVRSYSQTMDSIRVKTIHLNRLELRGFHCHVVVNTGMPAKHIQPLNTYTDMKFVSTKL